MGILRLFLIVILVVLSAIFTVQQDQPCFLPDGKQMSTCIRLHYCNQFQQLIRQYSGRPPMDVVQNINAHVCASGGFVCCPDNAIVATPTTTTPRPLPPAELTKVSPAAAAELPQKTNLQTIKNHPNLKLINEPTCGTSNTNRIVGGVDADLNEIPYAALLGYQLLDSLNWQCGGSLISKKFVLTAAHCITRELSLVRLGEHKISTIRDCDEFNSCADPVQDIKIERIIKHTKYKAANKLNDIALLKLVSPADTTKNNVKTICLPTTEDADIDKLKALQRKFTIFGWGRIGEGDRTADVLQKAYLPYVDNQDCAIKFQAIPQPIYSTYLCAGGFNKTDSCKGDSGGGITSLAIIDRKPKIVLYGVVSFGIECSRKDIILPGVYTNIAYYLDWILDNMSP
ncbi:hypothetical protein PVAND_003226 [Polypedilum vanderplanki]|uniref:Peptidase S1 domain-containing protein n=1 Tax=Polypedilum vanderplanki TaxID=319348 RepID=A0A9J6BV50_POLVA|nr:hypothetical protein PVAND_003226 [Polypedilum vanderplanki]